MNSALRSISFNWLAGLLAIICGLAPNQVATAAEAEASSKIYMAISTNNVEIPPDQLQWLIKPLTLEEVRVETMAWRDLLKQKAMEITAAEIAVKRTNEGIKRSKAAASDDQQAESGDEKARLLQSLIDLRMGRVAIIERLNVVLKDLKAKGGDPEPFTKYRDAVDDLVVDVTDTSAVWTFMSGWMTSDKGGIKWVVNLTKFIVTLVFFFILALVAGKAAQKGANSTKNLSQLQKTFFVTILRRAIMAIGLLVAVTVMGISVTPLLALITAAGLVVGLALQGTLSNFASGLLLLFYRPFDVNDAIDAGGAAGTVFSMNLMSTIIKTWDNKVMIVPNNKIWGDVITNISRTERRRVDMVFGISYSDSIDKAEAILDEIVESHPKILKDPAPVVRVHQLGDSSVNFVVRPWVEPANYWDVYWDITRKVKEEFDKQDITIPFPQRDVHLQQESKDMPRDRP